MNEENQKNSFDPKVQTLYQSCLQFIQEFGRVHSTQSRKLFSSIYVQYYECLKDDYNMPLADEYLDLKDEYCEGLEAVRFVYSIASYYHKKFYNKELVVNEW